jgi:hypothetical protein
VAIASQTKLKKNSGQVSAGKVVATVYPHPEPLLECFDILRQHLFLTMNMYQDIDQMGNLLRTDHFGDVRVDRRTGPNIKPVEIGYALKIWTVFIRPKRRSNCGGFLKTAPNF